jgi:hypothetical protein
MNLATFALGRMSLGLFYVPPSDFARAKAVGDSRLAVRANAGLRIGQRRGVHGGSAIAHIPQHQGRGSDAALGTRTR